MWPEVVYGIDVLAPYPLVEIRWKFEDRRRPLMMFRSPCHLLPTLGPWVTVLVAAQLVER